MSSFPVVHSVLDPQALLREVTTSYDIGSPVTCVLLRSWINEVYRVQTSHGHFILKVFRHGWRAPDEVAYEIELMQHLAACGIRVEPPVFTRARTTFCQLPAPEGQRSIVLYPMLEGQPPLPPSESIYRRVGQAIAQMHQALDTFMPTHPRRALDIHFLAEEPLAWLQPYLEKRRNDWDFLASLVQQIRTQLESLQQTGELSQGPIHGDATLDNLLIAGDGGIGIYDFDQSGPGWRAYDLQGVFYWAWEIKRPGFWTALLEGYRSVLPLSTADIAAMPYFPVLNRLWCMGFEAHVIAQNNGQWIVNSDYFDNKLMALRQWTAVYGQLHTNP
jgi:Ser/Thr protein kinase RdoA (MazF antagonist)